MSPLLVFVVATSRDDSIVIIEFGLMSNRWRTFWISFNSPGVTIVARDWSDDR